MEHTHTHTHGTDSERTVRTNSLNLTKSVLDMKSWTRLWYQGKPSDGEKQRAGKKRHAELQNKVHETSLEKHSVVHFTAVWCTIRTTVIYWLSYFWPHVGLPKNTLFGSERSPCSPRAFLQGGNTRGSIYSWSLFHVGASSSPTGRWINTNLDNLLSWFRLWPAVVEFSCHVQHRHTVYQWLTEVMRLLFLGKQIRVCEHLDGLSD